MKWGKYFWKTFHLAALAYPEHPTPQDKKVYADFYINFGNILPCKKCSTNYNKHLNELPIYNHLSSRQELFGWTVLFHNIVNQKLGKKQWATSVAWEFYSTGDYDVTTCSSTFSFENMIQYTVILLTLLVICLGIYFFLIKNKTK